MMTGRLALLASCCISAPVFAQGLPPQVPRIDTSAAATQAAMPQQAYARPITQGQQPQEQSAVTVPRHMPPPIDPVSPDKALTAKERAGLTVARRWINKFQTPHLDPDGVEHFTAGRGQIQVVTAVDHITDIALAPGEIIAPPLHIGDPDWWKFHPAVSGSGQKAIAHIMIKPSDAGLSTNMVVDTNKRVISIELKSRRTDYMPLVALDLPDDTDDGFASTAVSADARHGAAPAAASPCDQQPVVPPDQFRITGDNVTWRPIQAYVVSTPVGMKTCIDFPSSIGSEALPVLLALADDGGWFTSPTKKIVNVRFVHRRFIADEVLNRFILVDDVGFDQHKIRIERKEQ
jgi:P-type conjugative transfer protein TrbG